MNSVKDHPFKFRFPYFEFQISPKSIKNLGIEFFLEKSGNCVGVVVLNVGSSDFINLKLGKCNMKFPVLLDPTIFICCSFLLRQKRYRFRC